MNPSLSIDTHEASFTTFSPLSKRTMHASVRCPRCVSLVPLASTPRTSLAHLGSVGIHHAQAERSAGCRNRQRPGEAAGVGMDDDVRLKAHAADRFVSRRGGHRPLDHFRRDARPSDRYEVNAVCGAVVGGPIECEVRTIPRREIGLGEQHFAPLDQRERLGGRAAAGIRNAGVILAGHADRPAGRSIRDAETKHEARAEQLAGLTVRPQDDCFGSFTEPVSDRLTGRCNPGRFGEAANREAGEGGRRAGTNDDRDCDPRRHASVGRFLGARLHGHQCPDVRHLMPAPRDSGSRTRNGIATAPHRCACARSVPSAVAT